MQTFVALSYEVSKVWLYSIWACQTIGCLPDNLSHV